MNSYGFKKASDQGKTSEIKLLTYSIDNFDVKRQHGGDTRGT